MLKGEVVWGTEALDAEGLRCLSWWIVSPSAPNPGGREGVPPLVFSTIFFLIIKTGSHLGSLCDFLSFKTINF